MQRNFQQPFRSTRWLPLFFGIIFEIYVHAFCFSNENNTFNNRMLVYSLLPYFWAIPFNIFESLPLPGFFSALIVLFIDIALFVNVLYFHSSSTTVLAYIFLPAWHLLLFAPLGVAIGYFIHFLRGDFAKISQ